jgi:hypothetical protein
MSPSFSQILVGRHLCLSVEMSFMTLFLKPGDEQVPELLFFE